MPTCTTCHNHLMYTRAPTNDAQRLQPYLAYRPIEVIRRTLGQTTQMYKLSNSIPMRRHARSMFPFLDRKRIDEALATDTFFSSVRDVTGATSAQVFYGLTSHFINVFALKTEADGPQAFEDFARSEGLPNTRCNAIALNQSRGFENGWSIRSTPNHIIQNKIRRNYVRFDG
jgi:hypothetical protein